MAFVKAASLAEVPDGESVGVEVGGRRVCLVNVGGEVYALEDRCSHREFPLAGGEVDAEECSITCEWHGARFDLRSGAPHCPPATRAVPVYAVQVQGDDVMVDLG